MKRRPIIVNGLKFLVSEKGDYLKADMNGIMGWTSVWADNELDLLRRIKLALRGGQ